MDQQYFTKDIGNCISKRTKCRSLLQHTLSNIIHSILHPARSTMEHNDTIFIHSIYIYLSHSKNDHKRTGNGKETAFTVILPPNSATTYYATLLLLLLCKFFHCCYTILSSCPSTTHNYTSSFLYLGAKT